MFWIFTIAVLSILYKLFSKVIHGRIQTALVQAQSVDQAGFRSGFCCEDHLFAVTLLAEMALEWQVPLWIAVVDFKKAFDTVSHTAIWASLLEQGVDAVYIDLLRRLYDRQTGAIQCDRLSKTC